MGRVSIYKPIRGNAVLVEYRVQAGRRVSPGRVRVQSASEIAEMNALIFRAIPNIAARATMLAPRDRFVVRACARPIVTGEKSRVWGPVSIP